MVCRGTNVDAVAKELAYLCTDGTGYQNNVEYSVINAEPGTS